MAIEPDRFTPIGGGPVEDLLAARRLGPSNWLCESSSLSPGDEEGPGTESDVEEIPETVTEEPAGLYLDFTGAEGVLEQLREACAVDGSGLNENIIAVLDLFVSGQLAMRRGD